MVCYRTVQRYTTVQLQNLVVIKSGNTVGMACLNSGHNRIGQEGTGSRSTWAWPKESGTEIEMAAQHGGH